MAFSEKLKNEIQQYCTNHLFSINKNYFYLIDDFKICKNL